MISSFQKNTIQTKNDHDTGIILAKQWLFSTKSYLRNYVHQRFLQWTLDQV